MWAFIGVLSLAVVVISLGTTIVLALIKSSAWKKSFAVFGVSFMFFVIALAQPTEEIKEQPVIAEAQLPQGELLDTGITTDSINNNIKLEIATIVKVVDGDTLTVNINGKQEKVRLILVDTPESVHPDASKNTEYGKVASAYTSSQLPIGKTVYLQKDVSETDRYSRLLRYVWLEQPTSIDDEAEVRAKMYNAKLLLEGYAQVATFPPDVKYADMFTTLVQEARVANKGLWAYEAEKQVATTPAPSADQSEQVAAAPAETEETVYITPSGKKYHESSCRTIKNSKSEISLANAQKRGYEACKVCNP